MPEEKRIVYRIQDNEGRGPFKPLFSEVWLDERDDHINLRPWFAEFGRVDMDRAAGEYLGCGCLTLEQLRRWFTENEYRRLMKFGYHAVSMSASRIIAQSDIQCVFARTIPLNEDFDAVELYDGFNVDDGSSCAAYREKEPQ